MNRLTTLRRLRGAAVAIFAVASLSCTTIEAQAGGAVTVTTSTTSAICAGPGVAFCVFGGWVALLVGYDILRRNSCSGDFLHFGGPGFNEPLNGQNTRPPPVCPH